MAEQFENFLQSLGGRTRPNGKGKRGKKNEFVRYGTLLNSRLTKKLPVGLLFIYYLLNSAQVEIRLRRCTGSDRTCDRLISGDYAPVHKGVEVDRRKAEETGDRQREDQRLAVLIGKVEADREVSV